MTSADFRKHYDRMRLPIGMFVLRYTLSVEAAEDVVQTAFMQAWSRISDGHEPDNFKAYMYRTARNVALNWCRDNGRLETVPLEYLEEKPSDELTDTAERDARLWTAIDSLPEKCRRIFLMSKRDGMGNAEIAEELGISVKTVENHMTKAFSRLRTDRRITSADLWFLCL